MSTSGAKLRKSRYRRALRLPATVASNVQCSACMIGLEKLFDSYALRARLMPGLFVLLPAALAIAAWFPERLNALGSFAGVVALFGGASLLAQCVRDRGKALERELFNEWGGIPSTALLRHRDGQLNPLTKERYRRKLEDLIPGIQLPTVEAEQEDPQTTDRVYASCCDYLRERTRNPVEFSLLLSENISYGTRRNLLGMRPAGICTSLVGLGGSVAATFSASVHGSDPAIPTLAVLMSALCLALWSLRITREWVQIPAVAYAERLLAACEQLKPSKQN